MPERAPIPVLIRPGDAAYHTAIHCIGTGTVRRGWIEGATVTDLVLARKAGKRRCETDECAGMAYYWWQEGEELLR